MTQLYAFHFLVESFNVQHGWIQKEYEATVVADKYSYALTRVPGLVPEPEDGHCNRYTLLDVTPHAMVDTQPKTVSH